MKLSFLSPLYARPGPFASVYLDTSREAPREGEEADRSVELRWQRLRADLLEHGTDQATIGALGHVAGSDRALPGPHGQAIFAAHGRLALAEELPEPPSHDTARTDMLPDAMPLALQHAPDIPYAALAVHRADPVETGTRDLPGEPELEVDLQVGRWPMSRVSGAVVSRRWLAGENWDAEVGQLLDELAKLADDAAAEVVVLSGSARMRSALVREVPARLRDRIVTVAGDGHSADSGRALLEQELEELLHGCLSARDRAHLARFAEQRQRYGSALEGLSSTVAVLQRGRARAVLVNRETHFAERLWVGMAPTQLALTEPELRALGPRTGWQEPADAALIRAAVGTGAELVVVPERELVLRGGVGILLREELPARTTADAHPR
ncbi:hypothetical protein GCM10010441_57240 [Kitasatospora paracochleata]|uniref:Peptide subunit release factor 1 (ERF1) n=1 Tax=Kitasatospora paracochleata TaxID=58354 RepID=A0ABT1IU42_9ACTN|nr:hypothetical protein [Kitasatospora paracochleata]MCP2308652.1 hypothetical protein [Kitasatospora paracochleata]